MNVCEGVSTYMEMHCDFDCIYLDFSKAFDRVSHEKLIYQISDILWIIDFLSHRRQRVMCNGVCSNWSEVTSGIPQGSVLGPLLFTIFINYLPLSITSHIQIFAYDTKIYNTVQDSGILINDLNKLVLWSKEWLLPFNTDKCNILHFGKNNPNIEYSMDEKLISASHTIKDLEIIEDNFKFEEHMSIIFNNANSKLGIIKNTFHELTIDNFIILYKALVRPILEYCCTTWAPHFIKDHKEIEKVRKRATKLVKLISHLPYGETLKKLSLTTLYYRRQRADVLQVFRIINGIEKLDIG